MDDVVMDVARKMLYLCLVRIDDFRLSSLECRDEFGDVEDLGIVEDAGLDFLRRGSAERSISSSHCHVLHKVFPYPKTKGLVPVVAAILQVGPIQKLLFSGKVKDSLANGKLSVDLFLGQPKINDVEETDRFQGIEELSS